MLAFNNMIYFKCVSCSCLYLGDSSYYFRVENFFLSAYRHLTAKLALGWRIRLTQHLLKTYLKSNAFYKVCSFFYVGRMMYNIQGFVVINVILSISMIFYQNCVAFFMPYLLLMII